jgi:type I restriction enzyme, R subunit
LAVLTLKPLSDFGSTVEIVNGIFGSREQYMQAIKELENELYKTLA